MSYSHTARGLSIEQVANSIAGAIRNSVIHESPEVQAVAQRYVDEQLEASILAEQDPRHGLQAPAPGHVRGIEVRASGHFATRVVDTDKSISVKSIDVPEGELDPVPAS